MSSTPSFAQVADIEQIARMLAIQRRHDLAGVEIRKVNDWHFCKAKFFFDLGRDALRSICPQDREDLPVCADG
jgi:hypothetical protein